MACSIDNFTKNITITIPTSDLKDLMVQDTLLRKSNYDQVYVAPNSGYFENPLTDDIGHIAGAFNQAKSMWKNACPCLSNLIDAIPLLLDNHDYYTGTKPLAFVDMDHPMVVNVEADWIPKVSNNNLWPSVLFHEMSHVLELCTSCFGDMNKKIDQEQIDIHKRVASAIKSIVRQCAAESRAALLTRATNYLLSDPDFTSMPVDQQNSILKNYLNVILLPMFLSSLPKLIGDTFISGGHKETRTYIRQFFLRFIINRFCCRLF